MVRYRNVSTSRQGFVCLVYLAIALRSMARLVCGTSSTLRLSSFQYGSIALISGVAAGRNFSVRPSVISTSLRIIFARCCGALSSIMQIFPNLRTAAMRNLAKACMSNLSYCLDILLPSVVSNPNTMVFECEPVYTYDAHIPLHMCKSMFLFFISRASFFLPILSSPSRSSLSLKYSAYLSFFCAGTFLYALGFH